MRTLIALIVLAASLVGFAERAQAQVAVNAAVGAANAADDDWRWKYHNNQWWYYTPNNQWAVHHHNNWVYPNAQGAYLWNGQNIFAKPYYSGYRGNFYGNGYYNNGYYGNGYYGNGYYNGYGNGYYGYGNRGANVGAAIGGALGGNRGANIGAAIGAGIR